MSDIEKTIAERDSTHGGFENVAATAQELQDAMRASKNWPSLSADKKEALCCIATKLARILNGSPEHQDSWHDIQGYAKLAEDRCIPTLFATTSDERIMTDHRAVSDSLYRHKHGTQNV